MVCSFLEIFFFKKSKTKKIFFLFFVSFFLFQPESFGTLNRPLYRAPEALAMGEAVVGFIDDHNALWYNPAGAAAFDSFEFRYLNVDFKVAEDVYDSYDTVKNIKNLNGNTMNGLMGKNLYLQATAQSTLILPQFGITAMYDALASITPQNQTFPSIQIGFQRTSGIQGAFGFTEKEITKRRGKRAKKESQDEWRFGVGGKYFLRHGGYKTLTSGQIFNLNKDSALSGLTESGAAVSGDLGVQRIQHLNSETVLSAGVSYLNIGDMTFNGRASPVRASLNAGAAIIYSLGIPALTVSADMHQITTDADFKQKLHIGAKFRLPIVSVYMGMSEMHFTYGVSADVWLLRVSAVSYAEDLGEIYNAITKRRYGIRAEFKFEF